MTSHLDLIGSVDRLKRLKPLQPPSVDKTVAISLNCSRQTPTFYRNCTCCCAVPVPIICLFTTQVDKIECERKSTNSSTNKKPPDPTQNWVAIRIQFLSVAHRLNSRRNYLNRIGLVIKSQYDLLISWTFFMFFRLSDAHTV